MDILLCLAAGMIGGLLLTRLVRIINLPNVTAYLIAGLLMGPYFLGVFTKDLLDSISIITTVALGFIAFSIGAEFKKETLKQIGSKAITITMWEGLTAVFHCGCCADFSRSKASARFDVGCHCRSDCPGGNTDGSSAI